MGLYRGYMGIIERKWRLIYIYIYIIEGLGSRA